MFELDNTISERHVIVCLVVVNQSAVVVQGVNKHKYYLPSEYKNTGETSKNAAKRILKKYTGLIATQVKHLFTGYLDVPVYVMRCYVDNYETAKFLDLNKLASQNDIYELAIEALEC